MGSAMGDVPWLLTFAPAPEADVICFSTRSKTLCLK